MDFGARALILASCLVLILAACGGGSDSENAAASSSDSNEVATLEDTASADTPDASVGSATSEADPEQAALAFSQCMRDEGIDFPDLAVDADGAIELREVVQNMERNEEFRSAMQTCRPELAAGGFGGGRGNGVDRAELEQGLLAYTDCLRGEGLDVGDLTLGEPGQGQGAGQGEGAGQGQGPGNGEREGGFGGRAARMMNQLGLDADDPEVAAAIEACESTLDEIFTEFGPGSNRDNQTPSNS